MSKELQNGLLEALGSDYRGAALDAEELSMLDYAVKLTESPHTISKADVEGLRSAGFGDRGIHDICAIAAYFAFVNRIADGLGVELETRFPKPVDKPEEKPMAKRKQSYASDDITVTFDPNLCIHSAVCLQSLPEVFDVAKRRWIRPENAAAGKVAETVKSCPSGALQYQLAEDSGNESS